MVDWWRKQSGSLGMTRRDNEEQLYEWLVDSMGWLSVLIDWLVGMMEFW